MTEEERIFSGKPYTPSDPELKKLKLKSHKLSQILRELFAEIGEGTFIQRSMQIR